MNPRTAEDLQRFNADVYAKEPKSGHRQEFFEDFGGLKAVADLLRTDLTDGLPASEESSDFKARRENFGTNEMPKRKERSLLSMIWEACQDLVIIILTIAAVVSIVLGSLFPETVYEASCDCFKSSPAGWVEGVAIIVAVVVVVLVGSIQDYDKELKFRKLGKTDVRFIKVIRGGFTKEVKSADVLVGDVVLLDWGKAVPADGFVISADDMKVDEASVTGEPEPVSKNRKDPWLMANTNVVNGSGKMLVTATGPRTEWGRNLAGSSRGGHGEHASAGRLGADGVGHRQAGPLFRHLRLLRAGHLLGRRRGDSDVRDCLARRVHSRHCRRAHHWNHAAGGGNSRGAASRSHDCSGLLHEGHDQGQQPGAASGELRDHGRRDQHLLGQDGHTDQEPDDRHAGLVGRTVFHVGALGPAAADSEPRLLAARVVGAGAELDIAETRGKSGRIPHGNGAARHGRQGAGDGRLLSLGAQGVGVAQVVAGALLQRDEANGDCHFPS